MVYDVYLLCELYLLSLQIFIFISEVRCKDRSKDRQTESEGWRKTVHANRNKKPGVTQIKYFKTKTVIKDKKGHYIIIKNSVLWKDIKYIKDTDVYKICMYPT